MKLQLHQTCVACPEQYDAYYEGKKIGYMRLRHGHFLAEFFLNGEREIVYETNTEGDGLFKEHEREIHLTVACAAIIAGLTVLYSSRPYEIVHEAPKEE